MAIIKITVDKKTAKSITHVEDSYFIHVEITTSSIPFKIKFQLHINQVLSVVSELTSFIGRSGRQSNNTFHHSHSNKNIFCDTLRLPLLYHRAVANRCASSCGRIRYTGQIYILVDRSNSMYCPKSRGSDTSNVTGYVCLLRSHVHPNHCASTGHHTLQTTSHGWWQPPVLPQPKVSQTS
jgi:hypothetical protein